MALKQVKTFNLNKMGSKKGWCLQNVRLGFGITTVTYGSALADYQAQLKAGTIHPLSTLPTNCSVPIYCDTDSKYEHVIAYHNGRYYSDKKEVNIKNFKVFGWGECCSGTRVVSGTIPKKNSFLPDKGYWQKGDYDTRISTLAEFMYKTFPSYTNKKALGPIFGTYLVSSIKTFQKRTGLTADGMVGPVTYAKLKDYGFKG